jgi:hypothetical protein
MNLTETLAPSHESFPVGEAKAIISRGDERKCEMGMILRSVYVDQISGEPLGTFKPSHAIFRRR